MTLEQAYKVAQIIEKITRLKEISGLVIDTYNFGLDERFDLYSSETEFMIKELRAFIKETIEKRIKELEKELASL